MIGIVEDAQSLMKVMISTTLHGRGIGCRQIGRPRSGYTLSCHDGRAV